MEMSELDAYFDHILAEITDPACMPVENPFERTTKIDMSKVIHFHYTVPAKVTVSRDKLTASVFVSSSRDGEFTLDELQKAIDEKGINTGIDTQALERMVSEQLLDKEVVFAKGSPAINGADGAFEITAKAGAEVKEGDVIGLLVPGKEGVDGYDVFGNVIHGRNGHAPDVPQGKNTCLNSEHTALVAAADGTLSYDDGFFSVRNEYIVEGDLKRPNDRIDFGGDVLIYGNVSEGATINAGGSVYIRGSVTGASITAKSITADFTVRNSTLATSGGNVKLLNCEESDIRCEGNLSASTLIDCKVICSGEISCLSGQGIISGGIVCCIGKIVCQIVGSQMHEPTSIVLGNCGDFIKEKISIEGKINEINNDIKRLDAHTESLKAQKAAVGHISQEDEDFLHAATRIKLQKMLKKEPLESRLKYVGQIIDSAGEASLKAANTLHQNVTITIKKHTATTNIRHNKVTVYESDTGLIYM